MKFEVWYSGHKIAETPNAAEIAWSVRDVDDPNGTIIQCAGFGIDDGAAAYTRYRTDRHPNGYLEVYCKIGSLDERNRFFFLGRP